jgi:hypothetical protein
VTFISVDKAIRTIMGFGDIPQSNGNAYARLQRILSATVGELQLNVAPKLLSVIAVTSPDYTIETPADCAKVYKALFRRNDKDAGQDKDLPRRPDDLRLSWL